MLLGPTSLAPSGRRPRLRPRGAPKAAATAIRYTTLATHSPVARPGPPTRLQLYSYPFFVLHFTLLPIFLSGVRRPYSTDPAAVASPPPSQVHPVDASEDVLRLYSQFRQAGLAHRPWDVRRALQVSSEVRRHLARASAAEKTELARRLVLSHRDEVIRTKTLSTRFRLPIAAAVHDLIRSNMCKRSVDAAARAVSIVDLDLTRRYRPVLRSKTLEALVETYSAKYAAVPARELSHPSSGLVALSHLVSRLTFLKHPVPLSMYEFVVRSLAEAGCVGLAARLWVAAAWEDSSPSSSSSPPSSSSSSSVSPLSRELLELIVKKTATSSAAEARAVVQIMASLVASRRMPVGDMDLALWPLVNFPRRLESPHVSSSSSSSPPPTIKSPSCETEMPGVLKGQLNACLRQIWADPALALGERPLPNNEAIYAVCRDTMSQLVESVVDNYALPAASSKSSSKLSQSSSSSSTSRRPWLTTGSGHLDELPTEAFHMILGYSVRESLVSPDTTARLIRLLEDRLNASAAGPAALDVVLEQATESGDQDLALAVIDQLVSTVGLGPHSTALVLRFFLVTSRFDNLQPFTNAVITHLEATLSSSAKLARLPRLLLPGVSTNSRVYCLLLLGAAKMGKTGLAERIWSLAKHAEGVEEQQQQQADGDDVEAHRPPMRLPISAYTTMMEVYASEGRKGLPMSQTPTPSHAPRYVRGWLSADDQALRWQAARSSGWKLYEYVVRDRLGPEPDVAFFRAALDLFGRAPGMPARLPNVVRLVDLEYLGADERARIVVDDAEERGLPVPWAYRVARRAGLPGEPVTPPSCAAAVGPKFQAAYTIHLGRKVRRWRRRRGLEEGRVKVYIKPA
jgi:hypothetical protein